MSSGSVKNVPVEHIESIETTMAHIIPEFTSNLLVPIALPVYLFMLDIRMALAVLATVPIGLGFYALMTRGYAESYLNTVVKTKALNDTAIEYINGIEVIKAFGKAQSSYDKFVTAAKEGANCYIEWMRRCNIYFCLAMSVLPATMIAVLPIGGLLFRAGTLEADTFIQVILFSVGLLSSLITVISYGDDLAKLGTIIGEVSGILEQKEQNRPVVSSSVPNYNDISLRGVTFGYHEKEVLHSINAEFKKGTVNALVGPSGGGKTMLRHLFARFWDTDTGTVKLGGVDVKEYSMDSLMKNFSFVFQNVYLFRDTIANNIRFGQSDAPMERVIEAAKKACCHEFITALSDGYDTIIGEGGAGLSGGEKQRISIARAIMKDSPVIILDEATANVGPESEQELTAAIEALTKEKTILMIAHRLKTVRGADNIWVIDNGKIVQSGTHKQLIRQDGIYRRFVKSRELAVGWKV